MKGQTAMTVAEDLANTIDVWITALDHYDFEALIAKPSTDSWSMGQIYMHLIENTRWFFEQARICASSDANASQPSAPNSRRIFLRNTLPDELIEGPPSNLQTPQPESKASLMGEFLDLKNEISEIAQLISNSKHMGKTEHPGLRYLNGGEWFKFAEIHLRHHFRQKERVDTFLKLQRS